MFWISWRPTRVCDATHLNTASCYGDITVFSVDPNTGRLTLVLNQQIKDPDDGVAVDVLPRRAIAEDDGTFWFLPVYT